MLSCRTCPHWIRHDPLTYYEEDEKQWFYHPMHCAHADVDPLRNSDLDGNDGSPEIDDPDHPPDWCPLRPFDQLALWTLAGSWTRLAAFAASTIADSSRPALTFSSRD